MDQKINDLHIILKVSERCNLACTYCYFFFGGDESYKKHSPIISLETLDEIYTFIDFGCRKLNVKNLNIYFHGGEPLLMKKKNFESMCLNFIKKFNYLNLDLSIQTNGILIDEEWISLFKKYSISVGVSIDGTKEIHDQYRIDHKGIGSYDRVKKGLDILNKKCKGSFPYGLLSVINPHSNGKDIYNHFIHDLNVKGFDILLPDYHYENIPK